MIPFAHEAVYDRMLDSINEALAGDGWDDFQYELPFPANDNRPTDWLSIPFPPGWEASC